MLDTVASNIRHFSITNKYRCELGMLLGIRNCRTNFNLAKEEENLGDNPVELIHGSPRLLSSLV